VDQVCRQRPDERTLIKARNIVADLSEEVRKDLKLICYGPHGSARFVAGEQRNEIVVQLDEEGRIQVRTNLHQSYLEAIKGAVRRNWRPVVGECLGAIATVVEGEEWKSKMLAFSFRVLAKVVVDGHA
jgi:hypothetical protein